MGELIIILVVAWLALWAVQSLVRHNLRTCPRCRGSKKIRSGLFSSRYRVCSRCSGSGEVRAAFGRKP